MRKNNLLIFVALLFSFAGLSAAAPFEYPLIDGNVVVRVDPEAAGWERRAADDLAHYMGKMTGLPPLVKSDTAGSEGATIYVGRLALAKSRKLRELLKGVQKKDPVVRADAVAFTVEGNHLYVAGSNDDSHYFAVVELLRRWGCRWYMPTEFGECIPVSEKLILKEREYAYAPPFEVRGYWVSWLGDRTEYEEFGRRNFMNQTRPGGGGAHRKSPDLPEGGSLLDNSYVDSWVEQLVPDYQKGKDSSIAMPDQVLKLKNQDDLNWAGGVWDKSFLANSVTDLYLELYNRVGFELKRRFPDSPSLLGFLAYTNMTLPPQRVRETADNLVCYLAPIDVDPNHSLLDPRSPLKGDFAGALSAWARVMDGRVVIYDYDQSMLVWRDLPNPSHHVVADDVKEYRRRGILGVTTESRSAFATTFLNLHFRGQLYWDPDFDVDRELVEFYPKFYGPAAEAMREYWTPIFQAWRDTEVTEHEFFVAPVVYSDGLVDRLATALGRLDGVALDEPFSRRVEFTRTAFQVLDAYTEMVRLAAREGRYTEAVEAGERGLAAREALTEMSPLFTTYKKMGEKGAAWWPGEVELYRELASKFEEGRSVLAPLEWRFIVDPHDEGVWRGWAEGLPSGGRTASVDRYLQAQGVLLPDGRPYSGYGWYECEVELEPGKWEIVLPGVLGDAWLYFDGRLVGYRKASRFWWSSDYRFLWETELPATSKKASHRITVRVPLTLHLSGLFRRPFFRRLDSRPDK